MLGIIQLYILLYIRKKTQESGKVETIGLLKWCKQNLPQVSKAQITVTVSRLITRGLVKDTTCGLLAYQLNAGNEEQLEENVGFCKRISELY